VKSREKYYSSDSDSSSENTSSSESTYARKRKKRLVFADEKPMREADTYGKARRDPFTGKVPYHVHGKWHWF